MRISPCAPETDGFDFSCFSSLPPDKSLSGREQRRRADPAYEIMDSRAPDRNSEVGPSQPH